MKISATVSKGFYIFLVTMTLFILHMRSVQLGVQDEMFTEGDILSATIASCVEALILENSQLSPELCVKNIREREEVYYLFLNKRDLSIYFEMGESGKDSEKSLQFYKIIRDPIIHEAIGIARVELSLPFFQSKLSKLFVKYAILYFITFVLIMIAVSKSK